MDRRFFVKYIKISLPIMLQAIATTAVSLVDNIMVGQLGDVAIASVAASNRFLMMFNFMLWGIVGTSGIFIAQYFGAKKTLEMKESFRFSLVFGYAIFIPVILMILLFNHQISYYFVSEVNVATEIQKYLVIMSIGYIPFVASQCLNGAMRSIKVIKYPVIATITGVVVNTILNYLLIFGNFNFPALGVSGAAIATVVSRFVEFIFIFSIYLWKKYDFQTNLKDLFKIDTSRAKIIFKKSLPLMANEFAYGAGLATLLKLYATRGATALAAYGIASTATDIFYSAMQGIMVATTVLVGHSLGSGEFDVAKSNAYKLIKSSMVIGIVFTLLQCIAAPIFPRIYNLSGKINPEAVQLSLNMIYIIAVSLWVQYTSISCYMVVRVGGDMISTLLLDGMFMWIVNIGAVAFFAYFTNYDILILVAIGHATEFLKVIVAYWFVKRENWLNNLSVH